MNKIYKVVRGSDGIFRAVSELGKSQGKGKGLTKKILAVAVALGAVSGGAQAEIVEGIQTGQWDLAIGHSSVSTGLNNVAVGADAFVGGGDLTEQEIRDLIANTKQKVADITQLKDEIAEEDRNTDQYKDLIAQLDRNEVLINQLKDKLEAEEAEQTTLNTILKEKETIYKEKQAAVDDRLNAIKDIDLDKYGAITPENIDKIAEELEGIVEPSDIPLDQQMGRDFYKEYVQAYIDKIGKYDYYSGVANLAANDSAVLNEEEEKLVTAESVFTEVAGKPLATDTAYYFSQERSVLMSFDEINEQLDKAKQAEVEWNENADVFVPKLISNNVVLHDMYSEDPDIVKDYGQAILKASRLNTEKLLYTKLTSRVKPNSPEYSGYVQKLQEIDSELENLRAKTLKYNPEENLHLPTITNNPRFEGSSFYYALIAGNIGNDASVFTESKLDDLKNVVTDKQKELEEQLGKEIADVKADYEDAKDKADANQSVIDEYETEINNRTPTADELDAYEKAKENQAALDAKRDELEKQKDELTAMQDALSDGKDAVALGGNAKAIGEGATAIGANTEAMAINAIAMGNGASTTGTSSITIGAGSTVSGANSIAIGGGHTVTGNNSGAFGDPNNISGNSSYAFGNDNTIAQDNTFVLGNNVSTTQANSVVLGNNSTDKAGSPVDTATIGSLTYSGFSGVSSPANGVISIGSVGGERQIVNVGAGQINAGSTDAINGSQLFSVANTVNNVAKNVVNNFGGNAELKPDGTIVYTDIGGTGKDNIDDAIRYVFQNATGGSGSVTTVKQGKNTTIAESTDKATGDMTYVVNADSASVSKGSDAVSVVKGTEDANGNTDYAVDLSDASKASLAKADTAIQSVTGDKNVVATRKGNDVTLELADDVTANSFTAGDVSVKTDGINAGDKKVTNVADGVIAADSKDAVNGSQLNATNNRVTTNEGDIATNATNITANANEINKGMNFGDGETANNFKLGDTVDFTGDENITATTTESGIEFGLVDDVTANSVTTGDVSISTEGLNAGDKKVTNVADGVIAADSKDAVNGSQLNATNNRVTTNEGDIATNANEINKGMNFGDGETANNFKLGDTVDFTGDENITATTTESGIEFGLVDDVTANSVTTGDVSISTEGLNAGGKKVTNVADGAVTKASKDAVNGSQLNATNNRVTTNEGDIATNATNITANANEINKGMNFGDGETANNFKLGDTVDFTGDENITATTTESGIEFGLVDDVTANSVTTGDVSISTEGLNAGDKKVTNVADGVIAADSKDAVNGSQLNAVDATAKAAKATVAAGKNVTVDTTTNNNGSRDYVVNAKSASVSKGSDAVSVVKGTEDANGNTDYAVDLSDASKASLAKADSAIQSVTGDDNITATTDTNNNVTLDLTDDLTANSVTTGDVSISVDGVDAGNKVVTNVADGAIATDSKEAVNGGQLNATNNRVAVNEGDIAKNATNITTNANSIDKGMSFGNGETANNFQLGDTVDLTGDANITATTTKSGVEFGLNKNLDLESVTTGDVSMSANGINAGDKVISNVGRGVNATDAVNVAQLNEFGYKLNGKIDEVGDEANAGIASAMALGSMPQAYLPGKSMVTGGIGSYNGESAVSVGLSKVSDNGRYVFKIGGSADTEGNFGGSAGIGMHF